MISVPIGSGDTTAIVAPTLNDGSAEALVAWAHYEFIMTIRSLRSAGYELQQLSETDVESMQTSVNTALSDALTQIDALYQ